MATSVRLDDKFVNETRVYAKANNRSIPSQIEHWAKIGRIVEDNPSLSYEFIRETLLSEIDIKLGKVTKYENSK